MAEALPVDTLIQGGAVGISIALIALLYLRGKAHDAMISNHVSKTDDLIIENTKAMGKMAGAITKSTEATDRSTAVSKRIEHVLDRR